jgi:ATP-dependent Clp protease ATP-binding subunit ClpA
VTDAAKKHLAKNGFDPSFGARPLKRYIQNHIENPLAMMILDGELKEGKEVKVDEKNGEIVIA